MNAADKSADLAVAQVFASPFACACLCKHLQDCCGAVQQLISGIDQAAERDLDDPLLLEIEELLKVSRLQLSAAAQLAHRRAHVARRRG